MDAIDRHEAELLLTELHHRFCNSFQVIAALARQWHGADDARQREAMLAVMSDRIEGLAKVHRMLSDMPPRDERARYWRDLCLSLTSAFGRRDAVLVSIDERAIADEQAHRLTLILGELVTNSLKHSLRNKPAGRIMVELRRRPETVDLLVSDSAAVAIGDDPPPPSRYAAALARSLGGHAFVARSRSYMTCVVIPRPPAGKTGSSKPCADIGQAGGNPDRFAGSAAPEQSAAPYANR